MTLPRKGLRKITVDNVIYAWNATGNDSGIQLSVVPLAHQDRLLSAYFDYHCKAVTRTSEDGREVTGGMKQQFVVTGYVVRQVILYALKGGWDLNGNDRVLNLGYMDNKIDLGLNRH